MGYDEAFVTGNGNYSKAESRLLALLQAKVGFTGVFGGLL